MESILNDLQDYYCFGQMADKQMNLIREPPPPRPPPPRRKYVSIFRIDGEPIIPPLITPEKLRELRKYKEKAIKIEQRLLNKKLKASEECFNVSVMSYRVSSGASAEEHGAISHRSYTKESENSILMLQNLLKTNAVAASSEWEQSKFTNLQKSQTLIYDSSSTGVLVAEPAKKRPQALPSQLPLMKACSFSGNGTGGGRGNSIVLSDIPAIVYIPPTPMTPPSKNIDGTETYAASKKTDPFVTNTPNVVMSTLVRSPTIQDLSSDESFTSVVTHSGEQLKDSGHNRNSNVRDNIKKYENLTTSDHTPSPMSSQTTNTPASTTPNTSPEKILHYSPKKSSEYMTPRQKMARSATSPSIKLQCSSSRSGASDSTPREHCSETGSAKNSSLDSTIPLIRSSSFTLENPSKVLIEHMRQQNSKALRTTYLGTPPLKANHSIGTVRQQQQQLPIGRQVQKKPLSPRALRDTIESKAKRVQKLELRPSKQKNQQKVSQQKLAQAAAATASKSSISPYHLAHHHSTGNLYKPKKSPYESKITQQSSACKIINSQQKMTPNKIKRIASSSASISLASNATKTNTRASTTSLGNRINTKSSTETATLNKKMPQQESYCPFVNQSQRDKFQLLIKQQQEEKELLQKAFEVQQQMLIDQLSKEMSRTQLNNSSLSCNTSSCSAMERKKTQSNRMQHHHSDFQLHFPHRTTTPTTPILVRHTSPSQAHQSPRSPASNSINSSFFNSFNEGQTHLHSVSSKNSQRNPLSLQSPNSASSATNSSLDVSLNSPATTNASFTPTMLQSPKEQEQKLTASRKSSTHSPASVTPTSRRCLFSQDNAASSANDDVISIGDSVRSIRSYTTAESATHLANNQREQKHQQNMQQKGLVSVSVSPNNANNSRRLENYQYNSTGMAMEQRTLDAIRHHAASKINAYARGFLIRRLFQTEQIQRIVQTIRDTLIFVINLHMETYENPEEANTPANIKLKARLLQQLSSASRTLHLVFFQTSIRERMDIIARDRKRIKTKLLAMNRMRTPKISG